MELVPCGLLHFVLIFPPKRYLRENVPVALRFAPLSSTNVLRRRFCSRFDKRENFTRRSKPLTFIMDVLWHTEFYVTWYTCKSLLAYAARCIHLKKLLREREIPCTNNKFSCFNGSRCNVSSDTAETREFQAA